MEINAADKVYLFADEQTVNKIKERNFTSDRQSAQRFRDLLEKLGINATVRRTLGADIDAACGQLRREYEI